MIGENELTKAAISLTAYGEFNPSAWRFLVPKPKRPSRWCTSLSRTFEVNVLLRKRTRNTQ
jgi:hypothetical protein